MTNRNTLNSVGLNAGKSSLVVIMAAATFNAGSSSVEFKEPSYTFESTANLIVQSSNSFEGVRVLKGLLEVNVTSDNFFEPSCTRNSYTSWNVNSNLDSDTQVIYQGKLEIDGLSNFLIGNRFQASSISLTTQSSISLEANKIQFGFINIGYQNNSLFEMMLPTVKRLTVANWNVASDLWINPIHEINGAPYLEIDGYAFLSGKGSISNINELTILSTNKEFKSNSLINIEGTKIVFNKFDESINSYLSIVTGARQASRAELNTESELFSDAEKIQLSNNNSWESSSEWTARKFRLNQTKQGHCNTFSIFNLILDADIKQRCNVRLTNSSNIKIKTPLVYKIARARLISNANTIFKPTKETQGEIYLAGLGTKITGSTLLRLINAPRDRTFIIKKEKRHFNIKSSNNKFEV